MKKKIIICAMVLLAFFDVPVLFAENWLPTRILGIDYPVLAIQARIAGTVKIKCTLDENGKVSSAEILEVVGSSGARDLLGTAAQQNAVQWVFSRSKSDPKDEQSTVIIYIFKFEVKPNPAYLRSRFIFDFPQTVQVVAEIPPAQPTR